MIDEKDREEIREMIRVTLESQQKILHQSQFTAGVIKRRAIADKVIVFGESDRPTDNSTGTDVHFDTGTGVLSMWDGSAWLTTTLT